MVSISSVKPLRMLHETLRHSSELYPNKTAIVSGSERISYVELWAMSNRLAYMLKSLGVNRGDRVAIFLENTWHVAVAIYGSLLADAAFVLINPQTKTEKLAHILTDCSTVALIADSHLHTVFIPASALSSTLKGILVAGELKSYVGFAPLFNFTEIVLNSNVGDISLNSRNIPLDLCSLIYTSGSTGEPKGVMHTHQTMMFALQSVVEYLCIDETHRLLCVLPLAFNYGLYQLLMAVYTGATLVLERSFVYPAQVFKTMAMEEITVFPGVPTIFAVIAAFHESQPLCFPEIRCLTSAGAALPSRLNTKLQEIFPQAEIYRMYGQTECKRVCYLPPEQLALKPDSVGIAIPGTEVMVLNDAGQHVRAGEVGILYVRGPHVMVGYWNLPEKTAEILKPGLLPGERILCTRDLFTVDEDGYLYFIGRTDDIIKSGGEKISPHEVEKALEGIPGIREAAVIGVPDTRLGQAVHAFVCLTYGSSLREREIRKLCADKLEAYMVPTKVVILPELPKSINGKLDRKVLAESLINIDCK